MGVNLFLNPIITIMTLLKVLKNFIYSQCKENYKYYANFLLLSILIMLLQNFEGEHQKYFEGINTFFKFAFWWIGLGIASSIGFGSGLHTFVLYLGPHIAKVSMYTKECGSLPVLLPSKYNFQKFGECVPGDGVLIQEIVYFVALESFLWGFGTAIGELPPYFFSKAAALAKQKNSDIENVKLDNGTFVGQIKQFLFRNLQKYAFITVLISASIPNPLFDLAGISCGHFLIPFSTFFLATFIGKAINKVSIQSIFVIYAFSEVKGIINFLIKYFPNHKARIIEKVENYRQVLINPSSFTEVDICNLGKEYYWSHLGILYTSNDLVFRNISNKLSRQQFLSKYNNLKEEEKQKKAIVKKSKISKKIQ